MLVSQSDSIIPSNLQFFLACNVLYLNNVDVESLSGQMAVAKALNSTFEQAERLQAVIVNFKVSTSGITLVDTKKKSVLSTLVESRIVRRFDLDYSPVVIFPKNMSPTVALITKVNVFGLINFEI